MFVLSMYVSKCADKKTMYHVRTTVCILSKKQILCISLLKNSVK